MSLRSHMQNRIVRPLLDLLKAGVTPEKIAWSIALGTVIGIFPLLGTTTLLCAGAALLFRLNMVAIQLFNWFVYPVQLLLILPFIRAGEWIYRAPPIPLSAEQIVERFGGGFWDALFALWQTVLHAVTAWLLCAPFIAVGLYAMLSPLFRKWKARRVAGMTPQAVTSAR